MSIAEYIINRAQSSEYIKNHNTAPNLVSRLLDIITALKYKQYCVQWKGNNALLSVFEGTSCIIMYHDCEHMGVIYKPAFGRPFVEIEF